MTTIPTIYFNNTSYAWDKLGDDIDGEAADDNSGYSVSLSSDGTTVAIGAINNDSNSTNVNDNMGHVRVYRYDNSAWTARESSRSWYSIASSSDGTKLAAVVYGGMIYTSTDSGGTWTARESSR